MSFTILISYMLKLLGLDLLQLISSHLRTKIFSGAGTVVQQVLPLAEPVQIFAVPLPIQLTTNVPGKTAEDGLNT